MNEVTLEDSIINQHFQNYYPDLRLQNEIDTITGKVMLLTNYYRYYSFKRNFSDTDSMTVINFGSYTSHTRSFMLVTHTFQARKEHLFLGGGLYNDELLSLSNFYKSLGQRLPEEAEIIITDLFLRCRRGQAKTPIYLR